MEEDQEGSGGWSVLVTEQYLYLVLGQGEKMEEGQEGVGNSHLH